MKKIFGFTLFLAMMIAFSVTTSAVTFTVSGNRETIRGYDDAYAKMYEAIEAGEDSVDLTSLEISAKDVVKIYGDILVSAPEFFYLENTVSYYYHSTGFDNRVTSVNFRYKLAGDELEAAKTSYEQELLYIVSLIDPGLSEVEKALAVHDYLIASFEYDDSQTNFDVYSLFTGRTGVCQAYSLAYIAILRELGMEAVMVTSEAMNHAWNLVKVDGEWYHADLSFDDPAPDRPGHVLHENFLLSDESIMATSDPHYGWESTVKCDAGDYSGIFREDIDSAMIWLDEEWYYIDSETGTLVVSDFSGRFRSDIYTFDEKWYVEGKKSTYWVGVFSGVSSFLGYIFVNTPDEVLIYSPRTGDVSVYLEAEEGERIFGSWIYKNTLEYMISQSPTRSEDTKTGTFGITNFSIEEAGTPLPFDDVSRIDSFYSSVKYVYEHGLFKGVSSVKFAPDAPLTRAMYVTVLGRLCEVDVSEYTVSEFTDVPDGLWYTPYVEWASERGLVNGIGGGLFDPMGEITREQMIKITAGLGMLLRAGEPDISDTIILIEDRALISDWAVDGALYCVENGLIANEGELMPQEKASRAEAAEIVAKLAELMGT